ncbi:glutathione peroxidase [Microbacterium sp. X-17]|uniref:glutathione peroxidase n=1 Tax=Microbacterium sp. X-17 TaxID=3144404 RepID=UPI0031F5C51A
MADLLTIPIRAITGESTTLGRFEGQTMLIVNVASKCGLTPQYEALEALQRTYEGQGFTVLGFPCNQFMGQEPGTNEEILEYCSTTWGVSFPMFERVDVNGPHASRLYQELTQVADAEGYRGDIRWNFEKFVIGPDGVIQRFAHHVVPDDPRIISAIEDGIPRSSEERSQWAETS